MAGAGKQDMVRGFHDQAGGRNRMQDPFDRRDGAGFEVGSFHDRSVHPLHPVQLAIRSLPRIEQPGLFQEADRTFDGNSGRTSLFKDGIADDEGIGQTGSLRRRHSFAARASVGKNERKGLGQLRRRSRTCGCAGSLIRSKSDRTNPNPVTQSSKFSESIRNRGVSSPDGLSSICATIP